MKIPQDIDQLRTDMENAVKEVANKHAIEIVFKTMRYEGDGTRVTCSVDFNNKLVAGIPLEQVLFNKNCFQYDFKPSDYLREFKLKGKNFKLTGFNTRARTSPCQIVDSKGSIYKCSINAVKSNLKDE